MYNQLSKIKVQRLHFIVAILSILLLQFLLIGKASKMFIWVFLALQCAYNDYLLLISELITLKFSQYPYNLG